MILEGKEGNVCRAFHGELSKVIRLYQSSSDKGNKAKLHQWSNGDERHTEKRFVDWRRHVKL